MEPVTIKQAETTKHQKQLSEKQIQSINQQTQALRDSVENQTKALQQSSDISNKNLQKSIKEGIQEYDVITNCNNQLDTDLGKSNQVDSSIVKTVSITPIIPNK